LLLFMVLISLVSVLNLLYFYISTFRSVCAVPNILLLLLLLLTTVIAFHSVAIVFTPVTNKNKYT